MEGKTTLALQEAPYLNQQQLAAALGVAPVTVWKMRKRGQIAGVRVGLREKFVLADVRRQLEGREQQPESPQLN